MTTIRWSAVLFDLDGTLADSVDLILTCYRHTMRVHLGEELPDQRWLATIGTPLRDQLRGFARSPAEADAMLDTYVTFQRTVHDEMVSSFDGVRELLGRLREHDIPVAVVTSKHREGAWRTLSASGLDHLVDFVVGADDVVKGKPDPESVQLALERLGAPDPNTVLFVGDSPFDIAAGRTAGVRTAGVLWGPFEREALVEAGADFLVRSPAELGSLLEVESEAQREP